MVDFVDLAVEAVDITFETFGVKANYVLPGGGAPTPCLVMKRSPDRVISVAAGQPVMQGDVIEVRKSEVAAPAARGTFVIVDGPTLVVLGDPRSEDDFRLVWTMAVA